MGQYVNHGANIYVTGLWRSMVPRGVTPVRRGSRAVRLIGGWILGGWRWSLRERRAALTEAESRWSAMPCFTVHIRDEWLAVPCRDTTNTIRWLGHEALKRYVKNKPDNGGITAVKDTRFVVRRCQGLGLLDADDTVEDVLEDNDFVELGNDRMHLKYKNVEPSLCITFWGQFCVRNCVWFMYRRYETLRCSYSIYQ